MADVHSLRTDVDYLLRQHRQAGASSTDSPSVTTGYLGASTTSQQPIVLTQEQLRQLVAGQEDARRSHNGDELRQLSAAREELQQLRAQVAELTVTPPVRSAPPSPFRAPDPGRRSSLAVVQTQPPLSTPPFLGTASRRQSLDVRPSRSTLDLIRADPTVDRYERERTVGRDARLGNTAFALAGARRRARGRAGRRRLRHRSADQGPYVPKLTVLMVQIHAKAFPVILGDQDVVAQASSVQERVAAYMLPAINMLRMTPTSSGIQCIVVTATVDQASYAHRLGQSVAAPFGLRTGTLASSGPSGSPSPDASADLRSLQHRPPNILIGTPQRLLDVFAMRALPLDHLRLVVLDEVDDMVARNLSELVLSLVRLLPTARPMFDPFGTGRSGSHERQSILMASTVPQEVLNFVSTLQLRPPVRVLVRRESVVPSGSTTPGGSDALQGVRGARHHYLFVAIASGHSPPGHGAVSRQAQAWKLEALTDLVEDADVRQMVVFCANAQTVEAVSYKLASRGVDALAMVRARGSGLTLTLTARRHGQLGALGRYEPLPLVAVDWRRDQEGAHPRRQPRPPARRYPPDPARRHLRRAQARSVRPARRQRRVGQLSAARHRRDRGHVGRGHRQASAHRSALSYSRPAHTHFALRLSLLTTLTNPVRSITLHSARPRPIRVDG